MTDEITAVLSEGGREAIKTGWTRRVPNATVDFLGAFGVGHDGGLRER